MAESPRWVRLEEYLIDHSLAGTEFTVYEYAEDEEVPVETAADYIQSYLKAQRRRPHRDKTGKLVGGSKTKFVLSRVEGTRTRSARWAVAMRSKGARMIGASFSDDVLAKAMRAFEPDLQRLRELNPRAAKRTERQIRAVLNGAMTVLEAAAQGIGYDDDED